MKKQSKMLQVSMPADKYEQIQKLAKENYTTVSQYVRSLLIQKVDEDIKMKNVDRCL